MALQIVKPASPAHGLSSTPERSGECPYCQGSSFVAVADKPGTVTPCTCLLKREVLEYLGPVYAPAVWDHSLDASSFAGLKKEK